MIFSSANLLQFLEISSITYRGVPTLGMVIDSRSFHMLSALHIPVLFIRFQAGITIRLSLGHLQQNLIIYHCKPLNESSKILSTIEGKVNHNIIFLNTSKYMIYAFFPVAIHFIPKWKSVLKKIQTHYKYQSL